MTPDSEKEGPVESTSCKPAPEVPKDKPKGPQNKQRGPTNNQGKAKWHRPYPQGYRIPKLGPSEVDSLFNMARPLIEFTGKEQQGMNRDFPCK
ncbi:hypothetical protein O181_094903 [Austropuccinia psidii MF-1]|uniref:Uncharacterized protein n=1 Tax=Austropuccinia psidii MF-1 TaxID=1389203 RepID=A0A9Q3J2W3_9BASI|nr:hypothetical protein [Austropuccinia psidii MF-1]